MKNTYIYLLFLGLLALGSCSLDAELYTQQTADNFYQTPDDAYTALVGCYDGLQVVAGRGGFSFATVSEIMSDDCFGGAGANDGYGIQAVDEFDISRSPADVDMLNGNWEAYYKAVYRCNILLSKMDQIDWQGDDVLRNTYESETRYIRAYLYFEMVRLWGNIPLLTEASRDIVPAATPDEVYTVIAEDLLFASENLPAVSYTAVDSGRFTRWAAKSMLARVYLYYTGYYGKSDLVGLVSEAQALSHLEDVIASSGHGLVDDFSTLWPAASVENYAGEDNEEIVSSIKFTYTSDYNGNTDGNHWLVMFGMREYSYYPYGNGWGAATVNERLWNAFSANDTRRSATIIGIEEEAIPFDKINSQREYTGYCIKKYTPMSKYNENGELVSGVDGLGSGDFQISQFQDFVTMRYADVLLMAAELGSPNAQSYFDQVRQRAYKANFTSIPVNQTNIMEERHLEFALEGVRYWDLLRQGVDTAANTIAESTQLLSGGALETKTITAAKILETKGLSQIPNTQITLSGNVLQQNAGW
ncbi:RagB/SusD family nutrient uptake outer membrane protein [Flagellimonas baculiformis]|uniref:RagB/SusD family nutrient uptake outer membrane protein n=1 Tax=Flagellimonas baculiformis TaxID=3067310 RepID=UPI00296E5B2E|nr:RagB/SusD family nutrient uptake outer membrane protein [Muricauda sp. D6]